MATRTISNTGGNFNSTSTWVESAVPTSADTVVATSTSGQLTVNVASSAGQLILTAYTNTLTMNNTLDIYGNVTLGTGMTITGSSSLRVASGATITSNGKVWNAGFGFSHPTTGNTVTLADNWTINGTYQNGGTGRNTVNGNKIYCKGNLTVGTGIYSGSTVYVINGTGTISGGNGGSYIQNDMVIDTTGTTTIGTTWVYNGGTLTYSAGTVITSGSTVDLRDSTTTRLQTSGITWNNITNTNTATVTLLSDLYIGGTLTNSINQMQINGTGTTIYVGGGITCNTLIYGTAPIILTGTGTWSGAGTLRNNLTINTSGTTTIAGTVYYNTGTLTYTSGTVITAGSSIISTTSTSWNTSGMTWNNFNLQGGTQTLISDLNIGGNFSSSNPVVYNGADLILSGSMAIYQRMDGTSSIRYKGTGTWSQTGPIHLPLYIETPGTLTLAGTVCAEKINYISGTVNTAGSTIQTTGNIGSMVYSCSAITFDNVTTVFGTLTLNQPLNISGTYTVGASNTVNFAGAYGFSAGTFFCTTPGRIINFTSGITYNCNNLTLRGTNASRIQFKSSTSNAYTYFNLVTGGTCDVKFVNATDIDSSGGRLITDVKGTLLRTINWYKTNPDYFAYF